MTVIARRILRYADASGDARFDAWRARAEEAVTSGTDLTGPDLAAAIWNLLPLVQPDFALKCGGMERLSDLGIVGYAIASSRTLEQALGIWMVRAADYEPLMTFRSNVSGGLWRLEFGLSNHLAPAVCRFLSQEWTASFFKFFDEVTGLQVPQAEIAFRHAPLPGVIYEMFLPASPRFRAKTNKLMLPAQLLHTPLRSRNDEALDVLLHYFRQKHVSGNTIVAKVRRVLTSGVMERPTLSSTAKALGISERTLVRHLSLEGATFSNVLGEHRREYSLALAHDSRLGAKEIARAIGFTNHQSFRRAFREWTGLPLGQWRRREAMAAEVGDD